MTISNLDVPDVSLHDPYVELWEEKGIKVSSDLDEVINEKVDIISFLH